MRSLRISIAVTMSLLISVGVIMIYSSSGIYALQVLGNSNYFLVRHIVFLGISLCVMAGIMSFDYRVLRRVAKPLMAVVILMLALVMVPGIGRETFGARRWFSLGFFNFQPSELAKIAIIIYMADFLTRKGAMIRDFRKGFLPPLLVMGLTCVLIVVEPDLGNTLLVASITMIMMFVAGARWQHLVAVALPALPAIYLLVVRVPYRLARIMAFLDPWQDPRGVGFQLSQSQIALGSGGLFGIGLGKSQQKLFYLPAAHTDFILSIIGEEMGLIGTVMVVCLFILLLWQGARIAKRTVEPFGYYLCIGVLLLIGIQAVVNIGVSIGALPTKGLPLPFISYGGSALIFNLAAVGILLNVSRVQDL